MIIMRGICNITFSKPEDDQQFGGGGAEAA